MLAAFLDRLGEIGIRVEDQPSPVSPGSSGILASGGAEGPSGPLLSIGLRDTVRVIPARRLNPTHIVTQPHPGFPTDLQAQTMALLCLADGNSLITEKIFPDRFLHVAELLRMGADIRKLGANAMVHGIRELIGAPVMASDLRASAGLVIAGLAARGETLVQRVYHLDRGYERMELTLQQLGAEIERVDKDAV
jgi:UDP-N-acetylglucosamine 1-carboxyvinyltransferase